MESTLEPNDPHSPNRWDFSPDERSRMIKEFGVDLFAPTTTAPERVVPVIETEPDERVSSFTRETVKQIRAIVSAYPNGDPLADADRKTIASLLRERHPRITSFDHLATSELTHAFVEAIWQGDAHSPVASRLREVHEMVLSGIPRL